uniref:Synaptonemal complex central element protein 2 n=1 Tax=Xenopus tropicalis TaxID=8364 RepID=A0A6I8PPP9_XENTR
NGKRRVLVPVLPARDKLPPRHQLDLTSSSSLEAKSSNYFSALDATVEDLKNRAQILIDKINEGRNKDQALMKNFNESLAKKVAELSKILEARMYCMYDEHNKLLQERLQELPEIMDRIGELQSELKQVCQTVVTVYQDICVHPDCA